VQASAQSARQELDRRGIDADTLTPTAAPETTPAEQETASAKSSSEPEQSSMEPEQAPRPVKNVKRDAPPVREETIEELEQRIERDFAEARAQLDGIAASLEQYRAQTQPPEVPEQAPRPERHTHYELDQDDRARDPIREARDPRSEAAVPEPAVSRPERRTHYELDQDDRGRDPIHEGRDPRGEAAGAAEDQRRPADLAKARAARKLLAERAAERGRAAKDKTPQPGSLAAALAKVRAEARVRAEQAAQQAERTRQEQLATQVRPADHGRERD
jgi:hypothetical protein